MIDNSPLDSEHSSPSRAPFSQPKYRGRSHTRLAGRRAPLERCLRLKEKKQQINVEPNVMFKTAVLHRSWIISHLH